MIDLLKLLLGLAAVVAGGDLLVRGASSLAKAMGVSELMIGLTVVAFGTSAPELAVNLIAAHQNQPSIGFGNIVGSNLANIGIILGAAALIRPLEIHKSMVFREIPMMMLAGAAALVVFADHYLDHAAPVMSRADGLVLLLFFGVFLYYLTAEALRDHNHVDHADTTAIQERVHFRSSAQLFGSAGLVIAGLVLLVAGGKFAVDGGESLARDLGVSETVIALTLLAVGTSLPELVTSLLATWRGQTDIAVGNVVGSNIFNVLFILALTTVYKPIPLPAGGMLDLLVMLAFMLVLLILTISHQRKIVRWEGGLLLVAYLTYAIWRSLGSAES